jgi:hypothetical protein
VSPRYQEEACRGHKARKISASGWKKLCFEGRHLEESVRATCRNSNGGLRLVGGYAQQLSLDQMTQAATAIVRARIASSSASASGLTIYTHYKLLVTEVLKGAAPGEFVLPGGVANGYRQSFPGVPSLAGGAEYVLFLWTSPSTGLTFPVGFGQGILDVRVEADGSLALVRPRIGELMVDANGRPVSDHPVRARLVDLRSKISLARTAASNGSPK